MRPGTLADGDHGRPEQMAWLSQFLSGLLLLATWLYLYLWITAMTAMLLAPWDTLPGRAPANTWQRAVSDFFDRFPGSCLPGVAVLTISVGFFLARLAHTTARDRPLLNGLFVATNLSFFLLHVVLLVGTARLSRSWLPYPPSGYDVGYHRTWPQLAVTLLLVVALLKVQAKMTIRAERRQAN